jgi:PKD repeat protein
MKSIIYFLAAFIFVFGQGHLFGQQLSVSPVSGIIPDNSLTRHAGAVNDIAPLLQTRWGLGCFYNASCPVDTASHNACLHVPSGSGAVAIAQIMKYYQYPAHGTGEHGYTLIKYGAQYANFGATNYNWSSMPDTLAESNDGLATLIYQCGVAQNMNYGTSGSYSLREDIDSALVKYFNFANASVWKIKSDYSDADWLNMIKTELDSSHPLLYSGYNNVGMPLFFVCDGYQTGDLFHFNWGLGGVDNGYFSLNDLMPDSIGVIVSQHALFNLKPATPPVTADFTADKTTVRPGADVNFTDLSSGAPLTWNWKFTGGTPAASDLQNPAGIRYSAPGNYPVSLKVSNGLTSDSVTKTAYITVTDYPSSMSLDFESLADFTLSFSPWTVIDMKGGVTYGIDNVFFPNNYLPMSYICFNPSQTTPPLTNMQPHSGQKLGCCFSSIPPGNPNNKWLISPKLSLGINPQIEFWVKSYSTQWGYEKYNVAVSVTDLNTSSFVPINSVPEIAPITWTHRMYNLSEYNNKDVYIGIQCVTDNNFIFMIDDISITSSLGIRGNNSLDQFVVYPNPAKDHLIMNCHTDSQAPVTIDMISILGKKISSWNVAPVSGKIMLDVHNIPQGVYLLHMVNEKQDLVRKVSIIHQ